jgi:DNA-binding MarR family transcriptional regulator
VTAERARLGVLEDSALLLDNQLSFLIGRLHRALNDRYRPILGALGLTYPQYLAMLVLWEEQLCSVSHLGARLWLDSGTLSPLLKRLEAAGLITRTRSADDERSVQIGLTDAGRALRANARHVPTVVGSCIAGSVEEFVHVRHELTAILQRVETATPPPSATTPSGR